MRDLNDLQLAPKQAAALRELRKKLFDGFDVEGIFMYGSVARGEADDESDLDLLVVTSHPFASRFERHAITDLVFEVNLRYGTNLSALVVDRDAWEHGPLSVLPLRDEIVREGIVL